MFSTIPLQPLDFDSFPFEERWRTIGAIGPVVVIVIHTSLETDPDTGEELGRIVSARKATSHERQVYEDGGF